MASDLFDCPECDVVASRRHNFIRHLTATHGVELAEAEQLATARARSSEPAPPPERPRQWATEGHLRSLALLEDRQAAGETILRVRSALGGTHVLLRPVDAGITVMSLDAERCDSMISVGAPGGGGLLTALPPSPEQTTSMVAAYERKRGQLARASEEERFSLRLIAAAMADELHLAQTPWIFVAHEWRLHLSNGSTGKIDLVGFEPGARRLVVIELKASATHATKPDPNGWNAARQADEYADAIWAGRDELYPFFDRLIAAQHQLYASGGELPAIETSKRPTTAVWWPDLAGDHTPAWPAWNATELSVASDSDRVARYRRQQSSWRETQRGLAPGPHPTVPGRRVGSTYHRDDVAANRRLNFIDEAAYRHAERRAREVQVEGGTLDTGRLFGNLLSSMPMCFNLFGAVGTAPGFVDLMRALFDHDAAEVDDVVCEAPSPPQWDDRTAFDAQVDYLTRDGERRFLAVETKYTEPFTQTRYDRALYRQITDESMWFKDGAADELVDPATNQLWRGLLLMSVTEGHLAGTGRYVVIAPDDDIGARSAVEKTRSWMTAPEAARLTFVSLERIVDAADRLADRRLELVGVRIPRAVPSEPDVDRSRRDVIPDLDLARVRKWIDERNGEMPPHVHDQLRFEIDVADRTITVLECRPPWREDFGPEWTRFPICRFRYTKVRKEWSLYWRDRNLKFHEYDLVAPTPHIDELIDEVKRDPTCIFWG